MSTGRIGFPVSILACSGSSFRRRGKCLFKGCGKTPSDNQAAFRQSVVHGEIWWGLGVGFVPCLALEKALKIGIFKSIPLDNGPMRRELSIVLLKGPEPKGPSGNYRSSFERMLLAKRQANVEVGVDGATALEVFKDSTGA